MQEDASQGAIEHTIHGHSRAITDINFSAHHPDILATCAVDGYVHCWDLRRPRQPVLTFCDWFAGATQVKYNRQDPHIIASSHDQWLRIWDDRKGAEPLRSINAHESKIYGLDWNRTRSTGIVTCSLDKSIKFWDFENETDEPEGIIRTDFPVWRARHTPFGWGLLAMPQEAPGNLHLYERPPGGGDGETSKDGSGKVVKIFPGHDNCKVKEFLWRSRGGICDDGVDSRDFQLVSWGEDNQLRLQHVDPGVLESVGYVKGYRVQNNLNVTRKGAVYKTFRTIENTTSEKRAATITTPRGGNSSSKISALSAGMKRLSLPHSHRTPNMRAPAMKAKEKNTKPEDQHQKQIGWMSGIKFTKQENGPHKRPASRGLSLLHPEFAEDGDWDDPENLHDEIIRIHEQLPKITFEDVNMDKRSIVVSMNGPWGEEGSLIYITATILFPIQYPDTKPPIFSLGKTSLMSDGIYDKLKKEINQLAASFVSRKQGCLEAALCYLLGEVDLETSSTFFNVSDGMDDDDIDGLADESSSDDEDENIPAGASAMMSQELDPSATGNMLSTIDRNANVPLPKLCGARFCANGKLACFFPPKEDKVKSLLETFAASNNSRTKGEPVFESFGRLNNNSSPIPRGAKSVSVASEMKSDSDGSDESDYSSSSGSDTSPFHVGRFPISDYFRRTNRRAYVRASPTVQSQKSASAAGTGTNTGTGTGVGTGRNRPVKPKNIVSLHDVSDILPAKPQLAAEYAIFGDGPDVCQHNAIVAEKLGFHDLADIWRYSSMLLHNEVPLEVLDHIHNSETILVVARDAVKHHRRDSGSDSGIDVSSEFDQRNTLSGRVKWGTSPLGQRLISDLFDHYEKLADIQMLAMLSCVFSEPIVKDAVSHADDNLSQPQTPLKMKTPAFSLDYFPSDEAAWSMYQRTPITSAVSTPKISHTPHYGSSGSPNGIWGSDPASNSYSYGETPPLRSHHVSSENLSQQTQSLSTSPDNPRIFRRANSALASTFAASFSRPFSMTASSSPPGRKKPSPVETMLNSLAPSNVSSTITWGNTTVLGSLREQIHTPRSSYADDDDEESTRELGSLPVCTGINIILANQNAFDDEGCLSSPLLRVDHAALYANYRRAYAQLLYNWGHPLARLEILKFNNLKDDVTESDLPECKTYAASILSNATHSDEASTPIVLGKKEHSELPWITNQGLDVTGYCLKHDVRLEPYPANSGGAVGRCERCKHIQRQLRCTVCLEPIVALFSPCLSCGCAAHEHCLAEYHAFGRTECPGGCECDCGEKATSGGVVESWDVMLEQMRLLDRQSKAKELKEKERLQDYDGKSDWESETLLFPTGGLGKGYSTLSKRIGQVRAGDWGYSGGRKKARSIRQEETF
jgi:WD40 repeat protein